MSPADLLTASPLVDPQPVDRRGPEPTPRARSRPEDPSPPRLEPLALRFADDPGVDVPEVELPPGEITLLEGTRGTEPVRHRLVLDAARAGAATAHVVGGHRLDTTGLARRAQARGLDPGYVLRSSLLARAFTAYQLSVLLEERLPSLLEAEDAAAGLVVDPLRLYTDEDVRAAEARRLTEQAVDELTAIAEAHDVPLVVMQPPRTRRRELARLFREAADEHVLIHAEDGSERAQSGQAQPAYTVTLPREGRRRRVQDPRPEQARLDRYRDAAPDSQAPGSTACTRGEARG